MLVRNDGVRGKKQIADRWEKDVYLAVDQPNKGIPVYLLKREHGGGRRRMLHKNLLLPFMALPVSKPDLLDTSIPTDSTPNHYLWILQHQLIILTKMIKQTLQSLKKFQQVQKI